jgi:hypothetical protein
VIGDGFSGRAVETIIGTLGADDLKAAHVVGRRIASALKHTTLVADADAQRPPPEVALATRKASDTAETLWRGSTRPLRRSD